MIKSQVRKAAPAGDKVPRPVKRTAMRAAPARKEHGETAIQIGDALKRARQSRNLTLAALAKAANVSVGMLSQIERSVANPSWRVLTQIRTALGIPVSALFDEAPAASIDPPFVRRKSQHPRLDLGGHFVKELLTSNSPHNLQIMVLHIPPEGSSGDQHLSYPAEKGGLVLEGEFRLAVDGKEALLRPGDSFFFDSVLPHGFVNPSKTRPARVLWVIGKIPVERHL
jgi:transcriptional regulator with XRE-family HTH domain